MKLAGKRSIGQNGLDVPGEIRRRKVKHPELRVGEHRGAMAACQVGWENI